MIIDGNHDMGCELFGNINVEVFGTNEIKVVLNATYSGDDIIKDRNVTTLKGQTGVTLNAIQNVFLEGEINGPFLEGNLQTIVDLEACINIIKPNRVTPTVTPTISLTPTQTTDCDCREDILVYYDCNPPGGGSGTSGIGGGVCSSNIKVLYQLCDGTNSSVFIDSGTHATLQDCVYTDSITPATSLGDGGSLNIVTGQAPCCIAPTPTNTPTISITPTITPTISLSQTQTPTQSIEVTTTPTVSFTPTTTSPCTNCDQYLIVNNDKGFSITVSYVNCNSGESQLLIVGADDSKPVCSCTTPTRVGGSQDYTISNQGTCGITPTPSASLPVTPSLSLTQTPSASQTTCVAMTLQWSFNDSDACNGTNLSSNTYYTSSPLSAGNYIYSNSSCTTTVASGRYILDGLGNILYVSFGGLLQTYNC